MRPVIFITFQFLAACAFGAEVDFSHAVVPVLRDNCIKCHNAAKKKGGLSMNTREELLAGGKDGKVVVPGNAANSEFFKRLVTKDEDDRMPSEALPLSDKDIALLKAWIDGGLNWETGFAFKKPAYEPPLRLRRPDIPKAVAGRSHPIDCFLDDWLAKNKRAIPEPIGDAEFFRRANLDIIGLLPAPEKLQAFLADKAKDKRAKAIRDLLADDTEYAENWLTFWNDLLRNDYAGTGYIDGGRKQITEWLYRSLIENKPYDQFARELIAPTPECEGFSKGIKWRGTVSVAQSVPVQFAQSVGQTFLGLNLKCASCHDSFVDRWKLSESYGLAAVFSPQPLELYRCDKPTGKMAVAAWLFPELGNIDTNKPPAERLKQLAMLMTDPQNGRFPRAIANRIWQRLMGRGIVHPVDAMQSEPWNADLLDHLAARFADDHYDMRKLIAYICLSQAYQSKAEVLGDDAGGANYVYAGPRAKRMTAEQFEDAVWQITGTAPAKFDAAIIRGKPDPNATTNAELHAKWIWSSDGNPPPDAGASVTLRKKIQFAAAPAVASAVVTADNGYTLFVNGKKIRAGVAWETPDTVSLVGDLKKGANEIMLVVTNGGSGPNPAGVWFEARVRLPSEKESVIASDSSWEWTSQKPDAKGKFKTAPTNWQPAVAIAKPEVWAGADGALKSAIAAIGGAYTGMVRAALLKSDPLMRALGRPNREQIVSMRPNDLTTLEAMDLNNGQILDNWLQQGARNLLAKNFESSDALAKWLYVYALAREPTRGELALARDELGKTPDEKSVQDLEWAVLMLPEFQLVR